MQRQLPTETLDDLKDFSTKFNMPMDAAGIMDSYYGIQNCRGLPLRTPDLPSEAHSAHRTSGLLRTSGRLGVSEARESWHGSQRSSAAEVKKLSERISGLAQDGTTAT